MNKSIKAAVAMSFAVMSSQALAVGGVLGGAVGTVQAVLADLPGTLTAVVGALPGVVSNTLTVVPNVLAAVPGILTGSPIPPTSTSITVPLPGPAFLDATLVKLPGQIGVEASASGPVTVTVTTGL